jgi:hypothetical protein
MAATTRAERTECASPEGKTTGTANRSTTADDACSGLPGRESLCRVGLSRPPPRRRPIQPCSQRGCPTPARRRGAVERVRTRAHRSRGRFVWRVWSLAALTRARAAQGPLVVSLNSRSEFPPRVRVCIMCRPPGAPRSHHRGANRGNCRKTLANQAPRGRFSTRFSTVSVKNLSTRIRDVT